MGLVISSYADAGGTVVALAGRRIDAEPADAPRFPFERTGAVRDAIAAVLVNHRVRVLVCSAACGADLLALDAAQELGLRTRIILPFSAQEFRKSSVVDRPHPEFWGTLFDRVIANSCERGDVVELHGFASAEVAFSAANHAILEEAKSLAQSAAQPTTPIAIIVWNGAPRGTSDATKEFADLAKVSGFRVTEVGTLRELDGKKGGSSPRAPRL